MTIEKNDDTIIESRDSDVSTAPAAGVILTIQGDHEFQLTALDHDADESNVFEVIVRDQGGGNARTVRTFDTDSFEVGSFDDPVAEAGAGREIVLTIENAGSADNDYRSNYRVDRRKV